MSTKHISIDSLKIGMYLCGIDRPWIETPFLSHRFLIKSHAQIEKLKQSGVKEVDIDPNHGIDVANPQEERLDPRTPGLTEEGQEKLFSTSEAPPTPEERIAQLPPSLHGKSLTQTLSSMKEFRHQVLESVRDLLGNVKTSGVVEGHQIKELTETIISQTLDHEEACVALIQTREFSPDLYDHSLSVGTLAVLLGRLIGYDENQLRILGTAALLHDVGLLKLPRKLTQDKGQLLERDSQLYQSHPMLGVDVLKDSPGIPSEVLQVVAEHHGTLDQNGIPHNSSSNKISLNSRLIRIVDEYDELITGQHRPHPLSIREALRELYHKGQHQQLDQTLVSQFINQIGIYPVYSLVELSTGERGIVTANSPHNLLQPTILLFEDANRKQFSEPVPINFSVIKQDVVLPEIVNVLDPEQEGVRVEKVLADWVTL